MTVREQIAVVGMGVAVPGASSPEEFWRLLNNDVTMLGHPRDRFRACSFQSADPGAEDRSHTVTGGFLHELTAHARLAEELSDGNFQPEERGTVLLRHCLLQAVDGLTVPNRSALFSGGFPDGLQAVEEALVIEAVSQGISRELSRTGTPPSAGRQQLVRSLLARHYRHGGTPPRRLLPDHLVRAAAQGVLPGSGERVVVDAACASGLYALDLGAKSLLDGTADLALCGGVFVLGPRYAVTFAKLSGLGHHDEVRVFDEAADGTLFSDGAAMVALKRLSDAVSDQDEVLAVVAGVGASADGKGKAIYAPNPLGQRRCIDRARQSAGVAPDQVDWVIAHGTGTPAGDEVEIATLRAAAPPAGHTVTSNKSLIGHAGWSAGAVSLVHALLALRHGVIPAQQRLRTPAPVLVGQHEVTVPHTAVPWPKPEGGSRTVGVSAFGFGGANAHVILRDRLPEPAPAPEHAGDPVVLVAWSAHLPGEPAPKEVLRLLRDGVPEPARAFPERTLPTFEEARLSPAVTRQVDRGQHLAWRVGARFVTQHGELWSAVRERTGVVAACTGPSRLALDNVVRCYAEDLRDVTALPEPDSVALKAFLTDHRAMTEPTSSGTLPGLMPNILAARLANRYDLHGPSLSVDTGRTSALTAIHTASRYLRAGDLDLALVVAASADRGTDLAAVLEVDAARIAEGAFLLALSRRSTATAQGWPILATLAAVLDEVPQQPTITCGGPDGHTYLGADGLALVVHAAHQATASAVAPAPGEPGPAIVVTPATGSTTAHGDGLTSWTTKSPAAQGNGLTNPATESGVARGDGPATPTTKPVTAETTRLPTPAAEPAAPQGNGLATPTTEPTTAQGDGLRLCARSFRPAPATTVPPSPAIPAGSVVLVGSARQAGALRAHAPGAHIETADSPAARRLLNLTESVRGWPDCPPTAHLLVVVPLRDTPWPAPPSEQVLALHELAFLAAAEHRERLAAGSVRFLLLDPFTNGAPHPHGELFSGLAHSLRWELPDCDVRVLTTDTPDVAEALCQLDGERGEPRGTHVVHYRDGVRETEVFEELPGSAVVIPPPRVVVAAGGARGITAPLLIDLARRHRPRIWLLGSTELTEPDDRPGDPGQTGDVRQAVQRLRRQRQAGSARETLDTLRELCGVANVHYLACDVTRAEATARTAARIRQDCGRVDLVIHAAGLNRSGGLGNKSLADFRAVRDTKLLGYHNLKQALAPLAPKRWISFSSVLGTLGYPGETDYASANAFLSAAARAAQARGSAEQALAWGLWAEVGMGASSQHRANADRAGLLTPMSTAEGVRQFATALDTTAAGRAEVLYLGDRERDAFRERTSGGSR
ncbi:SDR family oxidoreductase [Amycolatopsis sp. NPDC088138]|uniref:SDR family oxidoreductase n=1 Tax=Amycolatopsis sp. NPDC088138 TaxID=3363938 RepID=UPI003806051C